MLWKKRLLKQDIPLKRHRFGIKLFEFVDSNTHFLIDFITYTGKESNYEIISNFNSIEKEIENEKETVCNKTSLIIKWRDRWNVFTLTSAYSNTMSSTRKQNYKTNEDIVKPTSVVEYNKYMAGIDTINRQLVTCGTVRKTIRHIILSARHFPSKLPSKRCVVCSNLSSRKITMYICTDCVASLCVIPCFRTYHTRTRY
ncbi:PGBD4 protein, partial [Pseudoatta argentina]